MKRTALWFGLGLMLSAATGAWQQVDAAQQSLGKAKVMSVDPSFVERGFVDQHGMPRYLSDINKFIWFSNSMQASEMIQASIDDNLGTLPRAIFYLANVSPMPKVITQYLVLPKLKDQSFRVALDLQGDKTMDLPSLPEHITVFELRNRRILEVYYVDSVEELTAMIAQVN